MRLSRSRGSVVTSLALVAAALIGLAVVAGAVVILTNKSGEDSYDTERYIDDLYLRIQPRPVQRGEIVTFFVQGEPPTQLRAHRYADLLTEDGERLFRLDSSDSLAPPKPIAYPLPAGYVAPTGTVRLQTRQPIQIPPELEPGRYIIQTDITGVRHGRGFSGTPSWTLPVVAKALDR